ncbi:MAG: SRPBCC family protein, partial [Cyanobacteria bacterium P01_E01_bin.6]
QPSYSFEQVVSSLNPLERQSLINGQPLAHATGNRYIGQILIPVAHLHVWDVVTDYCQFASFLPSVESSQVLVTEGDRTVVEQVAILQVLMAKLRSRIRTENIETPQTRVDFRLIGGDLKALKGAWTLHSITFESVESVDLTDSTNQPDFVLLRQSARAEAGKGLLEGAFSMIFMSSMKENLTAIRQESMRRASVSPVPLT